MTTHVTVFVGDDLVTTINFGAGLRDIWVRYLDAVAQTPTLVDITSMPTLPSLGMLWDGSSFIDNDSEQGFIPNNLAADNALFALVVNGLYVADHLIHIPSQPDLVAAYQSNPRFEVTFSE